MACEKWVDRYELWKEWQKNWRYPWLHRVLVLLGLAMSPTFEHMKAWDRSDASKVKGVKDLFDETFLTPDENGEVKYVKYICTGTEWVPCKEE